jgi:hypothetical protein
MKTLSTFALTAALAVAAWAQSGQNNTDAQMEARNAPDVFVYGASAFGPDKKGDSNFTIDVKNTGAKTIQAINWEYILPEMVSGYDKGSRVRFRDQDLKFRPDEKRKLTTPVHHYADKFVANFRLDTLRITRVEYEDGTFWQRPPDDK